MSERFPIGDHWIAWIIANDESITISAEARECPNGVLSYSESQLDSSEFSERPRLIRMMSVIISLYDNL